MSRRNQGPKLRWLAERRAYYITWTASGRSRKRSTGTADRETDVLSDYVKERGPKVTAQERIAYAVLALTDFFEGNTIADVTPQTCSRYAEKRGRSAGTVRRELGVLRAAINYGQLPTAL